MAKPGPVCSGLGCLQTLPVYAGPIPVCRPCSCLCRSGAVMQIRPLFTQILSLFTQSPPCLCRLYPCLHRRQRPCLQTLSLFILTLTLLNSIPALFTQAPFLSAEALAVCRVPTAWDQQQARELVPVCLTDHSPHRGRAHAVPEDWDVLWRGGAGGLLPRTQLRLFPFFPRLWHCF